MYPNFLPLHIERVKIYLIKNDFDKSVEEVAKLIEESTLYGVSKYIKK